MLNNASAAPMCLDTLQEDEKNTFNMGLYVCHPELQTSQVIAIVSVVLYLSTNNLVQINLV